MHRAAFRRGGKGCDKKARARIFRRMETKNTASFRRHAPRSRVREVSFEPLECDTRRICERIRRHDCRAEISGGRGYDIESYEFRAPERAGPALWPGLLR